MTQLLVLGLLKKEPLSGYDIQMLLQTSNAESWGGVLVGSIYHALKKLEKDGYIEIASIEQTGHRQKAIYRINEAGIKYFDNLLLNALKDNSVCFPTQLYTGLNFLDSLSSEQAIAMLLQQKEFLEKEIARLEDGKLEKKACMGGQLHPISELVFENMSTTIRQQIDFIDRVIQLITV